MSEVNPPEIPNLPPAPIRNQAPADFSRIASAFVGALAPWGQAINSFGQWVSSAASTISGYLQGAEQARDDAQSHANESRGYSENSQLFSQSASDYAAAAASNANFVGEWSGLTGPLTVPSSVYHTGTLWQLLRSIPNVAASEPTSGNADWAPAGAATPYPAAGVAVSTGAGWGDSKPAPAGAIVGTTDTQSLTNKTLGANTKESVSTGAAISITAASAPFQQITLTAPVTASVNVPVGVSRTLWINRGAFTLTWPAGTQWAGGEAPDLPASKWACITFTGVPGNTAGLGALVWSAE